MPKGIPNTTYSREFKQMGIEDMIENKMSYHAFYHQGCAVSKKRLPFDRRSRV